MNLNRCLVLNFQFTLQLSLACFAEYVLHLTRLNPDMMYVHQDSGLINVAYFKFDVDDTSGELDANRPVPFRLTPNILEFLTTTGNYFIDKKNHQKLFIKMFIDFQESLAH